MSTIKKYIEFFKENKEVIILIPTLLGGIYQVLNIVILVGLPYVRYFSVSQVIPDGLLILITSFWLWVAFKIVFSFCKYVKENEKNEKNEKNEEKSIVCRITYPFFLCGVGVFPIYLIQQEKDFFTFNLLLLQYVTYGISAIFIWMGLRRFCSTTRLDICIKSKLNKFSADFKNFIFNLFIILALGIIIKVIPNDIRIINESFIKINNFENYSYFSKEIKKTYKMKDDPILLYINKDYAFFKITENEDKILVLDANSLTEIKTPTK